MTETFVAHVNGSFVCYSTANGIARAFIGCAHATPREAIEHSDRVSGSAPDRPPAVTATDEDSGPTQNRTPGHPSPAGGPRRPAPTGSFPFGPAGAPDLGLVP